MRGPNVNLAGVIDESGLSANALARHIRDIAAEWRVQARPVYTQVGRWKSGQEPRFETQLLIAEALARKLGRPVSLQELGFDALPAEEAGIADYHEDPVRALESSCALWRADVAGLRVVDSAVSISSVSSAALSWLLSTSRPSVARAEGTVVVNERDVEGLRSTTAVFAGLDNMFGGRHSRIAAVQYLDDQVAPLLRGRYTSKVGAALHAAVAEFLLCVGWMAYDSARHHLARRYFLLALVFAQLSRDRLLGASVLSALSHQANFLGEFTAARDLARAARQSALHTGSPKLRAQFAAMEARAHASLQDRNSALRALGEAEEHFAGCDGAPDPAWISYFDEAELAAEQAHCRLALSDYRRAAAGLAAFPGAGTADYARSNAFAGIVRVESLIGSGELEEAASVSRQVLGVCHTLGSSRIDAYLDRVRRRLEHYGPSPRAREIVGGLDQVQAFRAQRRPAN